MDIVLTSNIVKDEYTQYIQDTFDLKVEDVAKVEIPNNLHLERLKDWNIGVICGASGSGKSTILKSLGEVKEAAFEDAKSVISNFDNFSPQEATKVLSAMGLASVPTWIRPYSTLSNGEKYRAEVALRISRAKEGEIILVDEYTSVVDRNVAKSMSNALQKYIRREGGRIILATCHYDIIEWLQPDWVYDLNKGGALEKGESLRQGRPNISLQVHRTTSDTWKFFKKHHYMSEDFNAASSCYCFTWDNRLVAFVGVLPLPSGTMKNAMRVTRSVVLPDYQGMGIGAKVIEFISSIYKANGYTMYIKSVNPRLGEYFNSSSNWQGTSFNGKCRHDKRKDKMGLTLQRKSYCHKYVGAPTYGYENLTKPIDKMRYDKSMEGQLSLWED